MWHPYLESDFTWLLQPVSGRCMLLQVAVSVTTPKKRGPKRNHSNCGWRDSKECVHDCPVFVYNVLRDEIVGSPALCTFHPHDSAHLWDRTARNRDRTRSILGVSFVEWYIGLAVMCTISSLISNIQRLWLKKRNFHRTKSAHYNWT